MVMASGVMNQSLSYDKRLSKHSRIKSTHSLRRNCPVSEGNLDQVAIYRMEMLAEGFRNVWSTDSVTL